MTNKKEAEMDTYLCFDIGGTFIKYGVISENGTFLTTDKLPTEATQYGGAGILRKVNSIVEEYLRDYHLKGICISTTGMVDSEKGKILYSAPLIPDYTGTPIKEILEKKFCLPCEVENDVNCAALAEYYAGAAKGSSISLCITVGTGIGGAVLINGQIFHGFCGGGCEIGYLHLPGGEFQNLASTSVMVRRASTCKKVPIELMNGVSLFDMAKRGDVDCIHIVDEVADILGMGIANACYIVNPEIVVLGGGIMAEWEYFGTRIQNSLNRYLLPYIANNTKLVCVENGNYAGMLGAFYFFMQKYLG